MPAVPLHSRCLCVLVPLLSLCRTYSAKISGVDGGTEELWLLCVLQLLSVERMNLYVSSIRVCFLLFESMRIHLKFQLEVNMLLC